MKRELLIINGILLVVLLGTGFRIYGNWIAFRASHDTGAIQYEGEALTSPLAPANEAAPATPEWGPIAERNPFSFDRTDLAIAVTEAPVSAGPRPFLFGTMSLGDGPIALLATGNPGNRDTRPYRVGEFIDGWQVVEIANKSVVIEAGGVRTTVLMNDPTAGIPRDNGRTLASGGASPQVSTIRAAAPGPAVQSRTTGNSQGGLVTNPPENSGEENVPPGFRIVRTPGFGNRVVPIEEP